MRATAQPIEGNKVKLSVEVDQEEMDRAVDAAFRKLSREVRVPGFRPGKVPRRFLEARMGVEAIRQEALRESLPDFYSQAVRDADIDAIAAPEIDITSGEESGPVAFDATVEVRPTVSVAGYQGLAVTLPGLGVSEEEIDTQVDRLRDRDAQLSPVQRPARDSDHVIVDIKASRHDEVIDGLTADDFSYEVGSGAIVPEVDDQLRGARVGDILKFNAAVGEDELTFQVLVKEVREKVLPEVDDAWASDASEFDTVAELRSHLGERLVSAKRSQAQLLLRDRALEALVALVESEPPDTLVSAEMERRAHDLGHRLEAQGVDLAQYLAVTGQDQEAVAAELRQASVAAVKADLALRALVEAESITATDEDVDAEMVAIGRQLGQSAQRVRREIERADQLSAVRSDVRKAKALGWLVDHVELLDEEGQPIERDQLFPEAQDEAAEEPASEEPSTPVESPA